MAYSVLGFCCPESYAYGNITSFFIHKPSSSEWEVLLFIFLSQLSSRLRAEFSEGQNVAKNRLSKAANMSSLRAVKSQNKPAC